MAGWLGIGDLGLPESTAANTRKRDLPPATTTSKKAASVVVGSSWRRLSLFLFSARTPHFFTQHTRASPGDGLIPQSIREVAAAGALLCCVEKLTGGGSRLSEGKTDE